MKKLLFPLFLLFFVLGVSFAEVKEIHIRLGGGPSNKGKKTQPLPEYASFINGVIVLPETFAEYHFMLLSCTDEAGNVFNFATHDNLFDVSTLGAGVYLLELRVGENNWIGMVELD